MVLWKIIQVKADLNFQLLSLKILFYDCSRLVIGPNLSFDHRSHWVLPDGFRKMLLKIIEYEKNEFKSENGWKFRSALTCNKSVINISNLSPTHFVFNIRHQHRNTIKNITVIRNKFSDLDVFRRFLKWGFQKRSKKIFE